MWFKKKKKDNVEDGKVLLALQNTEEGNQDCGFLYRMHDVVAEKFTPIMEYANDRIAGYGCNGLKLPPYSEPGDFQLVKVGQRKGHSVFSLTPVVIWRFPGHPKE